MGRKPLPEGEVKRPITLKIKERILSKIGNTDTERRKKIEDIITEIYDKK